MTRPARRSEVTREMVDAMNMVHVARDLVRQLNEAKSEGAWSEEEIGLLVRLCRVLKVEELR